MSYGLPYQGSKNSIADKIISVLPNADTFVDLFAGGCSMTHAVMLSGKYSNFICNDINDAPKVFKTAIEGGYNNFHQWIDKDTFCKIKYSDMFLSLVYSFGTNQRDYLYNYLVFLKKAVHFAIFGDYSLINEFLPKVSEILKDEQDFYKKKLLFSKYVKENADYVKEQYYIYYLKQFGITPDYDIDGNIKIVEQFKKLLLNAKAKMTIKEISDSTGFDCKYYFVDKGWKCPTKEQFLKLKDILCIQAEYNGKFELWQKNNQFIYANKYRNGSDSSFAAVEHLERINRICQLSSLSNYNLKVFKGDYRDTEIPPNSVIYCDPPYINTIGYSNVKKFDKNAFDYDAFYDYMVELHNKGHKVFISEYYMPEDRFQCILEIPKICSMSSKTDGTTLQTVEKLFVVKN